LGPPRAMIRTRFDCVKYTKKRNFMSSEKDQKIGKIWRKVLSGFEDNNYQKKSCIMVETSQATISERSPQKMG
jgi:hypothetical protein